MIEPDLAAPLWISKPAELKSMAEQLQRFGQIAVDTESNSLYAYQEQVCLIQFSSPEQDYLVDSLALKDLSLLRPIFADPAIEKIFHAAEYDLICLRRDFDIRPVNLFDTMQAARILGRAAVGLGAVLEAEFGITLDKRYQRANWGQRPLPTAMLNYARLDSHYLIALRERLAAALVEAGRWELAEEDFRRISEVSEPVEDGHAPCWKLNGSRDLTPQQTAVLKELCLYRDAQARRANLPPFKVLSNDMLLEVAASCPESHIDLLHVQALPVKLRDRHGGELLAAVRRGLRAEPIYRSTSPRPSDEYLNRLDRLREWRKNTARALGVESDVVLPRETLETIAESCPRSAQELEKIMALLPYRYQHYGNEILKLLQRG